MHAAAPLSPTAQALHAIMRSFEFDPAAPLPAPRAIGRPTLRRPPPGRKPKTKDRKS